MERVTGGQEVEEIVKSHRQIKNRFYPPLVHRPLGRLT